MDQSVIQKFDRHVGTKYHMFNSLFLRLPFDLIHQTGMLLPLLTERCEEAYANGRDPKQIIDSFFKEFIPGADQQERLTLLFNLIKYIERQVVLFDAVEDAAFDHLHDLEGPGTSGNMVAKAVANGLTEKLIEKLSEYRLRIVLTAHPTQFYPGPVLGIITDLAKAIKENQIDAVSDLLLQLGKTPFINRSKPSPLDEARSLIWFLRKVFYDAIPEIVSKIERLLGQPILRKDIVDLGFWPGGDRDGNPNVNAEITLETAALLRNAILISYEEDIQKLRRRLTFQNVYDPISNIGAKIGLTIMNYENGYGSASQLLSDLKDVRKILADQHDNLFAGDLDHFITKVQIFGFHFASLDIRQDSQKHELLAEEIILKKSDRQTLEKYQTSSVQEKIIFLSGCEWNVDENITDDPISKDILQSFKAIREIQRLNGSKACQRYVISHARHALDVFIILTLAKWTYGRQPDELDIVPLFESIEDLAIASEVMKVLYSFKPYQQHLAARNKIQTVMLGFSDGTKDGGYVKANWSIYTCKEAVTEVSRAHGVKVIFFDGRGGPPARGGGNTHKFYASLGPTIENEEVQLTIQGQTISSNFGSQKLAIYNIEQLLTAGVENDLYPMRTPDWTPGQRTVLKYLADEAFSHYVALKTDPDFLPYLRDNSTLPYYGESNIGSRPDKRSRGELTLDNLRAIPFVGSWSQLKQNVPGFYGFGKALEILSTQDHFKEVKDLYQKSMFFQTLVGNSMQSLAKSYFPLTAYMADDPGYSNIWNKIYEEYERSIKYLIEVTGEKEMMADNKSILSSINLREKIVLPLLTIQQYALIQIKEAKEKGIDDPSIDLFRKLITRTMPGIINAARNSA